MLERYGEAVLPTARGPFRIVAFRDPSRGTEPIALVRGDPSGRSVLCRVHSECLTSEVLGSLRCDCRDQLDEALDRIAAAGRGVLVYLRQEGRGIGLANKVRAYALQDRGCDTFEANRRLGFAEDLRRWDGAAAILAALGVRSVDLMTHNPDKIAGLERAGITVCRRVPLSVAPSPFSTGYLEAKRRHAGHLFGRVTAGKPSRRG